MIQQPCIRSNCPHFIPPERAGFSGSDGSPGIMKKNGRCAISGRIIARMNSCPQDDHTTIKI